MFIDLRKKGRGGGKGPVRKGGRGREGERERKREGDINVREKYPSAASRSSPNQGSNPQPRYGALIGDGTYNLLAYKIMPQPTNHLAGELNFSIMNADHHETHPK